MVQPDLRSSLTYLLLPKERATPRDFGEFVIICPLIALTSPLTQSEMVLLHLYKLTNGLKIKREDQIAVISQLPLITRSVRTLSLRYILAHMPLSHSISEI